jgi:hypothetical protein
MEFKGTKGKWKKSILKDRTFGIVNELNDIVCEAPSFRKGFENWEANALLISKAPEMFEMLKKIVIILNDKCTEGCVEKTWEDFQNGNGEDVGLDIDEFIKEAKQLIKEAKGL